MGRPGKRPKPPSSEEQSDQQIDAIDVDQLDQDEIDEDQALAHLLPDEQERQLQEKLAQSLLDEAKKAKDGEKATWNALYSLKRKEIELNQQMKQAIDQVKQKYELLKQPIFHQISQAVLGQKLQEALYSPEGVTQKVSINKLSPQKIQNFWGIVLDKEGLLTEQIDVDCITKVNKFKVELLDHKSNHLRIQMGFSDETAYFKNRELEVESLYDGEKNQPTRIIKSELDYKMKRIEGSLFTLLFDGETDINHFYNFAGEVYQNYANSLYFYFRQEQQQDPEAEAIEQEDEQDDEDDDDVQAVKPTKKVKQDKPAAQKPECKNQ